MSAEAVRSLLNVLQSAKAVDEVLTHTAGPGQEDLHKGRAEAFAEAIREIETARSN